MITANADGARLDSATRRNLFRLMLKTRLIEERIQKLYPEGDMRCPTHLSLGQEAAAVGVCAALSKDDYVISAHRSHAHYIAKGGSVPLMFAELYGKTDGCASGKGGSMHLIDLSVNFLGCVPIVGSTIAIGVGASFGAKLEGRNPVTVIFFGDGAVETGVFHESLNFAAVHQLPILFVCENNLYSVNTPLAPRQPLNRPITALATGEGVPSFQMDGQEVEPVFAKATELLSRIRNGGGPVLLELMTYRWAEHCGPLPDIHLGYRSQTEFNSWLARCPLVLHRQILDGAGIQQAADEERLRAEIDAEIDDAVQFAKASPFPVRAELTKGVYA